MQHYGLLLVLLSRSFGVFGSVSQSEIDSHIKLCKEFLAKGQLQDALTHCHAAIDGDPNNYLTYYTRGTVYLALNKANQALQDFDKVLALKPDFTAARIRRATILLKQAEFDAAENDAEYVLHEDPYNKDALEIVSKIEPSRNALLLAESLVGEQMFVEAVDQITRLIEVCPWAPRLRELRAECYEAVGNYRSAISDIRWTTKLRSDNTQGFYKLSFLLYHIGDVDESLIEIRNCLKRDPDHKECLPFYQKVKKVAKNLNDATSAEESKDSKICVNAASKVLTLETKVDNVLFLAYHLLCRCYRNGTDPALAINNCQEALKIKREPSVHCDSAEAYLAAEMYDDAIRALKEALELDANFKRAKDLYEKAQKLQKASESRDYYKILGVSRTASKQEIVKAYRKAAQKWHPDNFPDANDKKRAENKFIDIAAAKEVLTDEEKRAKFDNGEDPLDPESGKRQSPFQEFHHFHGSPFQFKFHFN